MECWLRRAAGFTQRIGRFISTGPQELVRPQFIGSTRERSFSMANFLFVYRGSNQANPNITPEEMQKHMEHWSQWIGEAMAKGWMKSPGDALTPEGRVVNAKKGDRRRLLDRGGRQH
jgi:hypothetical protein